MSEANQPLSAPPADLLMFNGHMITMDPGLRTASVLAARGQDIVYVGHDLKEAAKLVSAEAVRRDLKGHTVVPGLIDGHAHLISEGLRLGQVSVSNKAKAEALAIVRAEADRCGPGQWIHGYGWNQQEWPDEEWPTKEELDAVAPLNPVVLDRLDKHSLWASSLALKAAGLTGHSPDPAGGELLRRPSGELTGIVVGTAMKAVWAVIPAKSREGLTEALMRAQAEYLGFGLTSIVEAGATMDNLAVMRLAYEAGQLKLRIRAMLLAYSGDDERYLASGGVRHHGLYGERFSIEGIKIHFDGSLGSRSAWLLEDYADRPGHRGSHAYSLEELTAKMELARDHDLAISVHAIGDAAVRQTVEAMETVLTRRPYDHRWRIEHFQVVTPEDRRRALALSLIPSLQTVGLMNDLNMAEERLGPEIIKRAYAWRDILDDGGVIVNGSDCPVESVNPFQGMYAAVSRRSLTGFPAGGWRPEHKLTRLEALSSYTTWAAYSEFNEHRKGSLAPGKLADLAVLDRDPLTCPEDSIKDIQVLLTILGGEAVHGDL